jgi:hypothetical protein
MVCDSERKGITSADMLASKGDKLVVKGGQTGQRQKNLDNLRYRQWNVLGLS